MIRRNGVPDSAIVLQPTQETLDALSSVLGWDGALLFVWRHLEVASVRARFGEGPAAVAAGELFCPAAASDGGALRVGFEIVSVPRGLELGNAASFARIVELTAPTAVTRRLDPAAFYAALREPAALAPAHASHPLLAAMSRRALLEFRDEWDEPLTGSVEIALGGAPPISMTLRAELRSTIVLTGSRASTTW